MKGADSNLEFYFPMAHAGIDWARGYTSRRSFERIARKRGMEQGISRGQAALLRGLLARRFGPLPGWVEGRLNQAEPAQLETWALRVLEAGNLEEVFAAGGRH